MDTLEGMIVAGYLMHHLPLEEPMELLTVQEVARIFRVDNTTVRRWIKYEILPAMKLPHRNKRTQYRIRSSDIERILGGDNGRI